MGNSVKFQPIDLNLANFNFEVIFEVVSEGLIIVDNTFKILQDNSNFRVLFQLDNSKTKGVNILELLYDNDLQNYYCPIVKSVELKEPQKGDIYVDSIKKHLRIKALPILNNLHTLESVAISFVDITKEKENQSIFLEASEKYRKLIEASPDGITEIDLRGNITFVTPKTVELFGAKYSRNILGTNVLSYLAEEDHERAMENIRKALNNEKPKINNRYKAKKRDGSFFYVEISSRVLKDDRDKVCGLLSFVRDVNEKVKIEEKKYQIEDTLREQNKQYLDAKAKAEESDRLKSAFLANMSHEIRTPMNGIVGFSNLLMTKNVTEEQRKKYAEVIAKRSKDLLHIINDILDISKIEAGQLELQKAPFNPKQLYKDYKLIYQHHLEALGKKEIDFVISTDKAVGDVWGDESRIKQVLTNLIDNAIKYTVKGSLEIGFRKKENHVLFYVKDSGIGIPKSKLDLIFERFRQVDESLTRKYGGTGLGLSISKKLVNLMGGEIFVESKIGKGSMFSFTIPYEPVKLKANIEQDKKNIMNTPFKRKLLIVEDDLVSREYLKEIFELSDLEFEETDSGKQAVELIKNGNFDVVLMDIQLPDLNGLEATKQIREFNKDIVIIAQTAYAMDTDRIKCMDAGCSDYISKPIDMEILMKKVERFFPDSE